MNILITGGNGQLGSELKELSDEYSDFTFFFTDVKNLDITNEKEVRKFVIENHIKVILNCAAYTAVDKAEEEKDLANLVNSEAVKIIAQIAKEQNSRLIHISTDYIFDGQGFSPYTVNNLANPVNHYGESKWEGEKALLAINPPNSLIIRTSWVYSSYGNNFVKTMIRLGAERSELNVIDDQIGSPTYAKDLARFLLEKALSYEFKNVGIYHYTNEGVCSWYDFATEIMNLANLKCKINPIPSSAYPTLAKRPFYSVLDKKELKSDFGVTIPYWKESLFNCISILTK
ncbi:dTDP-4-dehydrorhamnose reductase [Zobellia laminariae]|uniref:dTDP-4-dehydrorhamnose reductase n=1 Tax=Zobellia laminariae TaxID=248906 RepID=UPI0012D8D441|nr:dTDP-4-dehydrorhamnose reductase [Zobellia laminariae]